MRMILSLRLVGPHVVILLFWIIFSWILWPWQADSHIDKDLPTDQHSERIYKDFEFFLKTFLTIVGAFGYLRIEKYQGHEDLIRSAMQALGIIGLAVAWLFGIFIICHQGSKLRRWKHVEWPKIYFWQEIWMCIGMLGFASALWIASLKW
jgi:hypothetical protein